MPVVKLPDGTLVTLPDEPKAKETPWYQGALDAASNIGTGLYKGLGGIWMLAGQGLEGVGGSASDVLVKGAAKKRLEAATDPDPLKTFHESGYKPKTTAERYVQSGAEGLGGAFSLPGIGWAAPVKNAVMGVSSGLGSQLGGDLSGGSVAGKVVGALLGASAGGLASSLLPSAPNVAKEILQDVDKEELAKAIKAMQEAKAKGIPINLSQGMPRGSNIDSAVELMSSSPQGAATTKMLREQPGQIQMAVADKMSQLPGAIVPKQELANKAQSIATAMGDKLKETGSKTWKDTFNQGVQQVQAQAGQELENANQVAAMARDAVRQAQATRVAQNAMGVEGVALKQQEAAARAALKAAEGKAIAAEAGLTGGVASEAVEASHKALLAEAAKHPNQELGNRLAELANSLKTKDGFITDANVLNDILKERATRLKDINLSSSGLDQGAVNYMHKTIAGLRQTLGESFTPFQDANKAYAQYRASVYSPWKQSPAGVIAQRTGEQEGVNAVKSKLFSFFEEGTLPGQSKSNILILEKQLSSQEGGREVFQDAAKTWMTGKVDKARFSADARDPTDIAIKMVNEFGHPGQPSKQWQTTKDVLAAMANSMNVPKQQVVKGFESIMDLMSKAAIRPDYVRGASPQALAETAGDSMLKRVGNVSVITPLRQPALYFSRAMQSNILSKVDYWMSSPEGAKELAKLGTVKPYSEGWWDVVNRAAAVDAVTQGETPEQK